MGFQKKLLIWFDENRRSFPWRVNKKPYNVWLSEIILQQTRAAQGLPYYERFLSAFPTVISLAKASEDQVMKLWQGLGYYSRARNLHATAKLITEQYEGKFPNDFDQIKSLKGIGDYTASAIASICFNQEQAVVDGNVYRVLSRTFGISHPIDAFGAHKLFKEKAQTLMKGAPPGDFNQAMMEFGAIQCVPKNPNCLDCIFQSECLAFQQGKVSLLPVKGKKVKVDLILINGITAFDAKKVKRKMKSTKERTWWRFYKPSKYLADEFKSDQKAIISMYNNEGYRNARIIIMGSESGRKGSFDTTYFISKAMLRSYVRQRFLNYSNHKFSFWRVQSHPASKHIED